MDQHLSEVRGRSSSGTSTGLDNQLHKRVNGHSPSPARFPNPVQANSSTCATGLGLGIDLSSQQYQTDFFDPSNSFSGDQQSQSYPAPPNPADNPGAFGLGQDFTQQLKSEDDSYGGQTQGSFSQSLLSSNFVDADFTIFPSAPGEQFNAPLFPADNQQLGGADDSMMATMGPNPNQPGSARQSPSVFQMPSFSPPAGHSRNTSLQPEMAFLPGQWNPSGPQFQGHRRNPSDISDVSSVAPSPNLSTSDAFEFEQGHSPMQRPQDPGMFADLQGISNFSISDHGTHSPNHHSGRSPSHSPAISPRLLPQQMPDMHHQQQQNYLLHQVHNNASYGPPASYPMQAPEAFPSLPQSGPDMQVPNIQVDYAPNHGVDGPNRSALDADSLTPPDRGRPKQRQRAVTDPFNSGVSHLGHNRTTSGSGSLSPNAAGSRSEASRSLSPLDRSGSGAASLSPSPSPNRRRQSTSAVPNNVIALRLAGEEGYIPTDGGAVGAKGRVQKHPATFQCDKCPKRFTRAYNLRSHLRTHTNERPFKCTVCGKSFARQHDRKRHESLHSGEKKFVCKGELQAGVQWGCGRRFARADALGRHFRSEAGRICIKPLLDEERQQRMQQAMAQGMVMQQQPPGAPPGMLMAPNMDPNSYPYENFDNQFLPQALINQFPFLATNNWATGDGGGGGSGMEDEHSGVSNFDGSDYDGEDGGYVSGSGYGQEGVLPPNYGGTDYASDYGGNGR